MTRKMTNLTLTGLAMLAALALTASPASAQCVATDDSNGTQCFTLYAGQTIDAGSVCVSVVVDNLEVTYTTTNGWELSEAHLWVGANIADMPQTRKGNPIPGQFPYNSGDISGQTSYSVSLPLAGLGFSCPAEDQYFSVAAHAAVVRDNGDGTSQSETGWSDGGRITEKGNWATLSTVTLTCDCDYTPPAGDCETAFARSLNQNLCFLEIDEDGDYQGDFSRWGWTNGPLGSGSYTFEVWAAAGQCDLSKGTLVGTLTVDYDGSSATVGYTTSAPYSMDEVQIYVGNETLPRKNGFFTVAPGQYPYVSGDLNAEVYHEYTFENLSGNIYVVAHANVCGF